MQAPALPLRPFYCPGLHTCPPQGSGQAGPREQRACYFAFAGQVLPLLKEKNIIISRRARAHNNLPALGPGSTCPGCQEALLRRALARPRAAPALPSVRTRKWTTCCPQSTRLLRGTRGRRRGSEARVRQQETWFIFGKKEDPRSKQKGGKRDGGQDVSAEISVCQE